MRRFVAASALCAALVMPVSLTVRAAGFEGIDGRAADPFASAARAHVFIFVRTGCPITNRYAPELRRIAEEFRTRGAEFWLVYPDPKTTAAAIKEHVAQYSFPGVVLRDPQRMLVKRGLATTSPEAAVFDSAGRLMYHGRIDDQWVNPGTSRPAAREHDLQDAISAVLAGRPPLVRVTQPVGCWLADVE